MMKKLLALSLLLCLALLPAALAEETATPLPFGVNFQMDGDAVAAAVGGKAEFLSYYGEEDEADGTGYVDVQGVSLGIGDLTAEFLDFDVQRNNSAREPRLTLISATLHTSADNGIAAFRSALAALTAEYGQPDNDPFDAAAVESYVEFGGLDATWTKPDVRINLTLQRMYAENLTLSYSSRLNYDAADLAE